MGKVMSLKMKHEAAVKMLLKKGVRNEKAIEKVCGEIREMQKLLVGVNYNLEAQAMKKGF